MDELRYCPVCQRDTYLKTRISWPAFIVLVVLGLLISWIIVVLAVVYLVYCLMAKKQCGVCGLDADRMEPPRGRFSYEQPRDGYRVRR